MNSKDRTDIFFKRKNLDEFEPIAETNQDISVCEAIKIRNKIYSVCCKQCDNSYACVEEIDILNPDDELYDEDEIICPVCHKAVSDSWEREDYNPQFECGYCGSIFSYERIINPTYNMTLVKRGEVKIIEEYKCQKK